MGLLLPPLLPSSRNELGHDPKTAFHQGGGERTRTVGLYIANVASTYLDAVLTISFGQ